VEDVSDFVVELFRVAAVLTAHVNSAVLAPANMSWTSYRLLRLVSVHGPASAVAAATHLVAPVDDVVAAAASLGRRGWVQLMAEGRTPITVIGTAAGRIAATALHDQICEVESRLLCPLTSGGVTRVRVVLGNAAGRIGMAGRLPRQAGPPV
jgi:hypothetical protein